jgi:glycosyltransferase involved in cell wall biosynthesis
LVFLLISTIEPRKGYDELITAASKALLAGINLKFIIVGRLGWVSETFRNDFNEFVQTFTDQIQWHENATDEEISEYVVRADIFLSPTRGEGFGIPVTEALNAGLPTLVRDIPVYQELYSGVVAMYGEGRDFSDLHGALMNTEKLYEIASARISKYKPVGILDSFHLLLEVFHRH